MVFRLTGDDTQIYLTKDTCPTSRPSSPTSPRPRTVPPRPPCAPGRSTRTFPTMRGSSRTCSTRPAEGWTGSACPGRNAERAWTRMPWASKGPPGDGRTCWPFPRRTAWIPRWPRISPFWPGFLSSAAYAGDGRLRGRSGPTVCADPDSTAMFPKRGRTPWPTGRGLWTGSGTSGTRGSTTRCSIGRRCSWRTTRTIWRVRR